MLPNYFNHAIWGRIQKLNIIILLLCVVVSENRVGHQTLVQPQFLLLSDVALDIPFQRYLRRYSIAVELI